MIAYHGKQETKDFYLSRIASHEAMDEIIHGTYWENGKGCAVGCTIHGDQHRSFETELGIPIMLAQLEDQLFEGQRNGLAKTFPRRFLESITPGADLSTVGWKFLHWLLTEHLAYRDDPRVATQIRACADVLVPLTKGQLADRGAATKARGDMWRVRHSLYAAAYAADAAARSKCHEQMAEKLIQLLREAI